jgi:hypothetical protein
MGADPPDGRAAEMRRHMIEGTAVIVRNPRVEYRKLSDGGGAVLLNLDTASYHGLNQTGSVIWETVGDGKRLDQVVPEVAALFDDAPPALAREVTMFIEDLVERDLLRVDHAERAPASNALGATEHGGSEEGA